METYKSIYTVYAYRQATIITCPTVNPPSQFQGWASGILLFCVCVCVCVVFVTLMCAFGCLFVWGRVMLYHSTLDLTAHNSSYLAHECCIYMYIYTALVSLLFGTVIPTSFNILLEMLKCFTLVCLHTLRVLDGIETLTYMYHVV